MSEWFKEEENFKSPNEILCSNLFLVILESHLTLSVPVYGFETIKTIIVYVFETGAVIEV